MTRSSTLRFAALVALSVTAGGCATGYLADRLEDRGNVVRAQLVRFGLEADKAQCVGDQLGRRLSYGQLRQLEIRARAVRQGLGNPGRLSTNDLTIAANNTGDRETRGELDRAIGDCGVRAATLASVLPPNVTVVSALPEPEAASAAAAAGTDAAGAPASVANAVWLNLGAAGSGQGISVDGSSVERIGDARTAWFRMIDDGRPSENTYRLRINCAGRTVEPVARRRYDAAGAAVENEAYPPGYERPRPIEEGTVTEIAFLSLCT